MWKISALIYVSYGLIGISGFLAILLTIHFSRGQRKRHPVLTKLDGKQLLLGSIAALSVFAGYELSALRDALVIRQSFVVTTGPATAQAITATADAFDLELVEAASDSVRKSRTYFLAAQRLFEVHDYRNAIPEYKSSVAALPTLSALLNLGISLRWTSQFSEAVRILATGLRLSQERERRPFEANFLFQLGTVEYNLGHRTQAEKKLNDALRLYREVNDKVGEANASLNLSLLYFSMGQREKSKALQDQAWKLYQDSDNKLGMANVAHNRALEEALQNNAGKALVSFRTALANYKKLGNRYGQVRAQAAIGNCLLILGKYNEGKKEILAALELAKATTDFAEVADIESDLARVFLLEKRPDEAFKAASDALRVASENNLPEQALALFALAQYLLGKGDLNGALARADEAFVAAQATQDAFVRADALMIKGEVMLRMGKPLSAIPLAERARDEDIAIGNRLSLAISLHILGEALLAIGKTAEGLDSLKQAEGVYARLGEQTGQVKELRQLIITTESRQRKLHESRPAVR
ncbi:MAG TPA: tetratricopeptide repeat protein [Thermoanaerobaculia bacterium]|nr:tetratricopeptide repeat protein [Thermoanaerobaculia bacterium]